MPAIENLQKSSIAVFGSTGSIGTQALDVARFHKIPVDTICAARSVKILENQIREFKPRVCAVFDESAAKELKTLVADTETKIVSGKEGVCLAASETKADIFLNAVMGMAGLEPTLCAIKSKKTVALANKETLVAAGKIVTAEAKKNRVSIIPVDSEHCAIHQCLCNGRKSEVKKLILTCSGGSYFGKIREDLENITPTEAVVHPKWNMGRKISVDSSSLMNKGLEILEAAWLFDMDIDNIDVVIHRESIIHSMVEYNDNAVIAQMSVPDMHFCIQYALTYPERYPGITEELDFSKVANLSFYKPDTKTFKLLDLARYAGKCGGVIPTVMNAANEAAVSLFLDNKIRFLDIFDSVCDITMNYKNIDLSKELTMSDILFADFEARRLIFEHFSK
ncbi:MAG: 1-deoxy-D-xylulose-5-phosphate reductoisomerase [Clostridia bacterium]|nr:1-deoxy-D-xylulose-5-phosphate reductoisomerase [Clostridia bacterium]